MSDLGKNCTIIENSYLYKDNIAFEPCKENDEDMQTIVAQAADELLKIVKEVNQTTVSEEDLLADNVYYFDRKRGTVEIAA